MAENGGSHCCGPGYASPAEAMKAPREKILYTVALYIGTGIQRPDYLATIDADPESPTYSQVISRLEMPGIGDELHHMGWNACSSCHHDPSKERRYLIVPGVRSSNLHIVDCGIDPKAPRLHKVIEGANILVVVSHDTNLLSRICTRVIWIDHGRVKEDGPAAEVLAHYQASTAAPVVVAA